MTIQSLNPEAGITEFLKGLHGLEQLTPLRLTLASGNHFAGGERLPWDALGRGERKDGDALVSSFLISLRVVRKPFHNPSLLLFPFPLGSIVWPTQQEKISAEGNLVTKLLHLTLTTPELP